MNYNTTMIGNRIKEARKSMKLTQEELAEKLEVARETVGSWERCATSPEFPTLLKMCGSDIFNCEVGYLLGEHEEKTRVATDICKEIGLREDTVSELQRLVERSNAFRKSFTKPKEDIRSFYPTEIHFIDFLINEGKEAFSSIDKLRTQLFAMKQLEKDKYYDVFMEAYKKACKEIRHEFSTFGNPYRAEVFYDILEEKLTDIITIEHAELLNMLGEEDISLNKDENEKLRSMVESQAVEDIVKGAIDAYVSLFDTLQKIDNIKYFEFDISQSFLELVKAFCKRGIEEV